MLSPNGICSCPMTNRFGVVLDNASVRRAAVEGVPESVIAAIYLLLAAIYLLHERSVARFRERAIGLRRRTSGILHICRRPSEVPGIPSCPTNL